MKIATALLQAKVLQWIEQWETSPGRMQSGYAYEETFVEMWQLLGQEVMQESIEKLSRSRIVKKNQTSMGEI